MKQKKIQSIYALYTVFGLALYLCVGINYAQQIVIDPVTKTIRIVNESTDNNITSPSVESPQQPQSLQPADVVPETGVVKPISQPADTGIVDTDSVSKETEATSIPSSLVLTQDGYNQEFLDALAWMHANGLTRYSNPAEYRPKDFLTREEASRIVGQTYTVLGFPEAKRGINCSFSDADLFDPTLTSFIDRVCELGLFQGSQGKFMPRDPLTNPQTMAVLIRMFEGKMSDETKRPRRNDYYQKGKIIGLTDTVDWNMFDTKTTREQVAIYVYRLYTIIKNEKLKTTSLNAMSQFDNPQIISGVNTDMMLQNLGLLAGGLTAVRDPELMEAIQWMFESKITQYNTIEEYRPYSLLLREESAKMLDNFTRVFTLQAGMREGSLINECYFVDEEQIDLSLLDSVKSVCRIGLLKGVKNRFFPKETITKAHFTAALIRLFEGKSLDETQQPRRKNYFQRAQELDIVAPIDAVTFDAPITRYEVAIFLYRFKVKYLLLQGMNSNRLHNEIIASVPGSQSVSANGLQQVHVYVDANKLADQNFEIGFVELFETRYKIVRTKQENYFTNNFVWYGDLFDLDEDKKAGTISLIVSNGYLVEGTIRRDGQMRTYKIRPIADTQAYYRLTIE